MEHPVYDDSNFNSTKEGLQAFTAPIEVSVHHGDVDWTVAEETAVRRKFDMVVTPLCTVLYLCRAVDR